MLEIRTYVDSAGRNPFESWFKKLDGIAAAKITVALARVEQGNLSNASRWERVFWSIEWISVLGIVCTAAAKEMLPSSCLAEERRSASSRTSKRP